MTDTATASDPQHWLRIVLIGRRPRYTLIRVVVLSVMAFVVFGFILLPVRLHGPSMLPNYKNGGINLVNRFAYLRHEPQRGDVVAVRVSGEEYSAAELLHDVMRLQVEFSRLFRPHLMYLKRIVGKPGETIEFSQGLLLVNGKPLDEPYRRYSCNWNRPPQTLGADEYFVVGDNRSMLMKDHTFLAPPRARIVGKAML